MIFADIIFIIIVCLTLAGALAAVLSGSLIYSLIGLVVTMFGIAGLYIYLNAPYIAMMQILIYVGAVAILVAFAVMLAGPFSKGPKEWSTTLKFGGGIIVSAVSFFVLSKVLMKALCAGPEVKPFLVTTKDLGRLFFEKYQFPFELISLLIVVAIIGAVMLALFSKGEK